MAQTINSRALVALAQFGVACGDLLQGPEDTITALATAGLVDPHPSAVAYAKSAGAAQVKIAGADAAAAEQLGVAMADPAPAAATPEAGAA